MTATDCGAPKQGTKSKILGNEHNYGDKVTYQCVPGFKVKSGHETRTCQASGSWSGDPLVCEGNNTKYESTSKRPVNHYDVIIDTETSQLTYIFREPTPPCIILII